MVQSKRPKYPLRDALLAAAKEIGENGRGKDGLVGYFRGLARKDPKLFAQLLMRALVLPPQEEQVDESEDISQWSREQILAELQRAGIIGCELRPTDLILRDGEYLSREDL